MSGLRESAMEKIIRESHQRAARTVEALNKAVFGPEPSAAAELRKIRLPADPSPPQERESAPTPLGDCPPSILHAAKIFELLDRWTPEQRAEVFYNIESRWCWHCGHEQAEDIHAECVATEMGLPPIAEIERREAAVERGEGVGGSEFFAAMREKVTLLAALRAAPSAPTREQVEALRLNTHWDSEATDLAFNEGIDRVLALYGESANQTPTETE